VEIFNNYARAEDLTAQLNERRQEIQAESEKRSQAIEGLQLEMEGLREGSEEYEQRFGEIQRMLVEREAWARYQEGMLMREHHRLTKEMYEQILDTIEKVSRERGFDVVLFHPRVEITSTNTQELLEQIQGRPVLYAAQGVDLTSEVLTRLNNAYQAAQTR
jgi:Skp family chaperone for outer membrane proteins